MTAAALSGLVLAHLAAAGVGHVVASPGSRDAPLLLAAVRAAAAGRITLDMRIDERDAGFTALGMARATGRPVAVVTTSGTAVGNLLPAVMEASHAGVPVVVVSADRPAVLAGTGANQTTRQPGIFGGFVRADAMLDATAAPGDVRHRVARLVAAATGIRGAGPGPVHLNLALDPPLVPDPDDGDPSWPAVDPVRFASRPEPASEELAPARTVVLAGDAAPDTVRGPVRLPGVPVLAEPSSNLRHPGAIATYRLLLTTPLAERIERVVVLGHPTLSRPVGRLLSRGDIEIVVVSDRLDWPDPGRAADRVLPAVPHIPPDPAWAEQWWAADERLCVRLATLLAGLPGPTGPEVAAAVVAATGPGDWLVLGASQSIRDADLAPIPARPPYVLANRGLSGIDGTVATATGVGLATGRPVTALLGDVTLAHDVGGLLVGPAERTPAMRLVVVNDDGGSIFHTLEQGDPRFDAGPYAGAFERVFATPHGIDVAALARAYGWAHTRVTDRDALAAALAVPVVGRTLIEVAVDRTGRRELDRAIRDLAGG